MTEDKPLSERPLHIRVAEALGQKLEWDHSRYEVYRERVARDNNGRGICFMCSGCGLNAYLGEIEPNTPCPTPEAPRYDTSWQSTGPLIEKYKISLNGPDKSCDDPEKHDCLQWRAFGYDYERDLISAAAEAPLIATCHIILALAEAGKLEER